MRDSHGSVRFGSVRYLSALLLVGLTGTVVYAAEITGAQIDLSTISTPAGKADIGAKGSYTLDAGQTADKIQAEFYSVDKDGNKTFVGSNTAPDPISGGKYQTEPVRLDKGAKYTVVLSLYVTGKTEPVATNSFSFTLRFDM